MKLWNRLTTLITSLSSITVKHWNYLFFLQNVSNILKIAIITRGIFWQYWRQQRDIGDLIAWITLKFIWVIKWEDYKLHNLSKVIKRLHVTWLCVLHHHAIINTLSPIGKNSAFKQSSTVDYIPFLLGYNLQAYSWCLWTLLNTKMIDVIQ